MKPQLTSRVFTLLAILLGAAVVCEAQDAVDAAARWEGKPYQRGGKGPDAFDAPGLTQQAFLEIGITLERAPWMQGNHPGALVEEIGDLIRNDLLYFGEGMSHTGIYIGDGKFWHANPASRKVEIGNVNDAEWKAAFSFGKRLGKGAEDGSEIYLRPWRGYEPKWHYVRAPGNVTEKVMANSESAGEHETWQIYVRGGGAVLHGSLVALKAHSGRYLSTDGSWRPARADRMQPTEWEWFRIERENGDGQVASGDRVRFLGSQDIYLGSNFYMPEPAIGCFHGWGGWGAWETFTIVVR